MDNKTFFVKSLPQLLRALVVTGSAILLNCESRAEGTKEVFRDAGLYSGDPAGSLRAELYTWAFSTVQANAHVQQTSAPEGREVLRMSVNQPWGGGGIFFVADADPGQVVERNCSEYVGGHLRFWLKSTNNLDVQIEFLTPAGAVQKSTWTAPSTTNQWAEMVVPFTSFSPTPNLVRIRGLFLITVTVGTGPKTWFVDHIRWTKPAQHLEIFPSLAQVRPGGLVQFTVEGRTASNEVVSVYPTFAIVQGSGALSPQSPVFTMSSVFRAGSSPTNSTVIAVLSDPGQASLMATGHVEITTQNVAGAFYLYAEDHALSVTPDLDSQIVAFQGGSAAPVTLEDVIDSPCEGSRSLHALINHPTGDAYSGWSFQWGLTNSLDSETFDLSRYYAGNLRLCFKATADLAGKTHVGIRSGNVPATTELSYLVLTNAVLFDGDWHEVAVPLNALAGSRPWADLTRVKNFFTISVVGATAGPQDFYVDNLRWEAEQSIVFSQAARRTNGDFYLAISGPQDTGFVLERTQDFINWERILTNMIGATPFEFTETNSQRSVRFFYRAETH